ncbi:radial spoke head protein 3 homolog B isoform X1 [Anolis carolinensis]|uniref:radial spoke head protein 3 homolog B isoform X1 n=2 Tax=Anolis carolinensis TaxID=28377 RepID=UPI002F2B2E22
MASTSVVISPEDGAAAGPSATYSYYSRPRALAARKRYRSSLDTTENQEEEPIRYANLMYERRVVRGNTYALHILPWTGEPDPLELQRRREAHRKALARKRAKEQLRTRTPDPLEGRRHVDVQTELYLEELADRIIEVDVECQTDAFLDRPATPLFIPAKTGRDMATQIWEGDLFDFDIEVRPMLEVLVGKTIEQALLEVMEEEELANMRAHQNAYLELRCAELAEVQRLEEQERRHREEKERRRQQQMQILKLEKETSERIAARAFAQRYLSDLIPSIFGSLRTSGYFFDPVERDTETGFLPFAMENVEESIEKKVLGRILADNLIRDVTQLRLDSFEQKVLLIPREPVVVPPPEPDVEPKPSGEALVVESAVEEEVLTQPVQPESSDQAEAPGQTEPSEQAEASGQPESAGEVEIAVGTDPPEQLDVPDSSKAEAETEIKDPEPQ